MAPQPTSLLAALTVALTVALSVPLTAAFPPPRPAAALQPVIANGTSVAVSAMSEAFLFCSVDAPTQQVVVEWRDPSNNPLPSWRSNPYRYQLGRGTHLPHAYLVFVNFSRDYEGVYTCVARGGVGVEIHANVIVSYTGPW